MERTFKLSREDKQFLRLQGYSESDLREIRFAAGKTVVKLIDGQQEKTIDAQQAVEILGRERFLSALGRAVFHWTSSRSGTGGQRIVFDSTPAYARFK